MGLNEGILAEVALPLLLCPEGEGGSALLARLFLRRREALSFLRSLIASKRELLDDLSAGGLSSGVLPSAGVLLGLSLECSARCRRL